MAVKNGYIITIDMVNGFIKEINECQKKNGGMIEIPKVDVPGIGNLILSFLMSIDAGFANTFKPILELKKILTDYVIPAVADPTKVVGLMSKIKEFTDSIKDLVSNPVEFIIKELLKPLDDFLLPIPLDLSMFIPGMKVNIDKGFKTLSPDIQLNIMSMITPEWIAKMPNLILLPIHIIVGLIKAVVKMITDALANPLVKIAELIPKLTVDFPKTVKDLILDVLLKAIEPILKGMVPGGIDMPSVAGAFSGIFGDMFSGKLPNIPSYKLQAPDLGKVWGFLSIIMCLIKSVLSFITTFPTLFFA